MIVNKIISKTSTTTFRFSTFDVENLLVAYCKDKCADITNPSSVVNVTFSDGGASVTVTLTEDLPKD